MNQPNDLQKEATLSLILKSPEFHDSKRYQELLQYLVDKSSKVDSLKETEIAHELFGKDSKFDPSTDPLIRSYISNLRKKLEHYYLTTTDNYAFKLEIPKGHYLVKYTPVEEKLAEKKRAKYSHYLYPALIIIISSLFIFREMQHLNSSGLKESGYSNHPVWKEFLNNNSLPTLIVLGDYILLSEKGKADGRTFLRVPQVNSEKSFRDSVKKFPQKFGKLEIAEVTYIGAGSTMGLPHLLNIFNRADKNIFVKLSNELTWDDFQKNNIIYLGTLKTLYKLDTLFSRSNIRYSLGPNSLSLLNKEQKVKQMFNLNWHGGNYEKNYSIILKLIVSNKNSILFLTGFSEVGVMDAIKSATDENFVSRINTFTKGNTLPSPLSFEMISEAEGVRYMVFKSEIKHFSPIAIQE